MVDLPKKIFASSVTENYGEWQTVTDGLPRPQEYTRSDLVVELAAENERLKEKEAHRIKVIRENENLLYSNIELRRKIEALASTGAVANDPVANHWPEAHEVADILSENKGFWRACSGCHETNEGHPTGPWSMVLGCNLGHGCHECGAIGAVWDTTDYADMGDYLAQGSTRPTEQAMVDRVLDAAGDYMGMQYGNTALHHPTDRARIKAAMEAGR